MSTLQIDLDEKTNDALMSLAAARGTAPADLVAEIVGLYVSIAAPRTKRRVLEAEQAASSARDEAMEGVETESPTRRRPAPETLDALREKYRGDPLDEIVGSLDADPVEDIDEVIYGR